MKTLAAILVAHAVIGCTTVRYPRLMPLTTNERAKMTCEELQNEIADAQRFKESISGGNAAAETAAFLGDFGLGNAMERDDARRSADARIASCKDARREKGCPLSPEEEAEEAAVATMLAHPAGSFTRWHRVNEVHGHYHTSLRCPEGAKIPMDQRVEGTGPLTICAECRAIQRQSAGK